MRPEHWLYTIPLRLRSLFRRREADQELDEELRDHVERRTEEYVANGLPLKEARRQALLEMGGVEKRKEQCRDARHVRWLQDLAQDLRYAVRVLSKSPGFTMVAVVTLALGIGANTAIFTMMNGLMLRTLPVKNPGQLVEILHQAPGEPELGGFSWDAYQIMRRNHVFSDLFIGSTMNFGPVRADKLQPQTVFVGSVGGTFFQALGVQPATGRLIGPEDVHVGYHAPVAVISWSFWKSRFNLDSGIIGKKIVVGNDAPLTIVGVAQRGFYGLSDEAPQDVWWPTSVGPSQGWGSFNLLARLKPGVSIKQALPEMSVLFQAAIERPDVGPFVRLMQLRIAPAGAGVSTPLTQMLSTPLKVLMATVGLLLLLACANLAGLLLARGASRQHEMAVRACLGAPRARLLRQTLTESLLLSLMGSAAGIFLAYFAAHALVRIFKSGRFIMIAPVHFDALTTPDAHVLLFTAAIALVTGVLCGAAPAISASNAAPAFALQPGSRIGETKRRGLFGKGLVASQVALSLVLVSSAGLFVGYLSSLRNLNLGFQRNNLLLLTLDFAHAGYTPAQFAQLSQELMMRLDAIPGVSSATFSGLSPMEGPGASAFAFAEDHPEKRTDVSINQVASDYFRTYGTPFLAGRDFSARDQDGSPVAIINQAVARDCFGDENPIGRHITLSHITLTKGDRAFEVVGLVGDAKYNDLQQPPPPTIYEDLLQQGFSGSQLAIRSSIDLDGVAAAVRQTEAAVMKGVPIARITTMNDQIDSSIVPQRLIAMLSAAFGALGALLAAIGLYGLLAYTVARRTHEIGVRIALGATRGDVIRIILSDTLWMVCAGLAIGIPLAFWATTVAATLIHGLPTKSPAYVAFGATAMIAVGLVSAYIPARRAMRVDPIVALRYE